MRAKEFIKIILEAEQTPGYYTVGDSHAEGLGAYAGKPWINRAKHSMKSTEPMHMAAIREIPKGSVVVISLGANDATMTNDSPSAIASRVSAIVSASESNGNVTQFLLFPVGTSKNISQERRESVRNAIKNAVNVPITDLEGQPLQSDGVHAQPNVYRSTGKKLSTQLSPKTGKDQKTAEPGAAGKDAVPFTVEVPQGRRGPDVADVQKSLEALGIPLPKYGVDGIQGKETTGAIKKFQEQNGLEATGSVNKQTADKLNAMLKAKPEILAKLKKSTNTDVKSLDYSRGAEEVAALTSSESTQKAKLSAEKYLGRPLSDEEWNWLVRATSAEASNNSKEQAYVMGVMLNRTRSGNWGNNVISVLRAPNQFQAVTGTKYDKGPSRNFSRGPTDRQLANIVDGAINILPQVPSNLKYFTAASKEAYGPGTNIGFRDRMIAQGGERIGGTIFAANVA
jgi:peptidoglycan hydrolase-like protein with peptidoglycan-binding domain